jgi:L-ascorbate metabolism protein UlaG (beta-lactamase superfamily)
LSEAGRLTWVGHATALIELAGTRILTDPVLRARIGHLRRQVAVPAAATAARLDAVLISHLHHDHVDRPSLRLIDPATPLLAPRGAGGFLTRRGFREVRELAPGDSEQIAGLRVTATPASHGGGRGPLQRRAEVIGFTVEGPSSLYFAGDTDYFEEMAEMRGRVDVALLPIWGWGPKIGAGHLNPESAARAAALIAPSIAVPIHWGTYFPAGVARLTGWQLRSPPRQFAAWAEALAPDVEVRVLAPGEEMALQA